MKTLKKITIYVCKCERCQHTWEARVANPQRCVKCKSQYWNTPRKAEQKPTGN